MDGATFHNQDHYVEDQVMLLDVILLTSLITTLNVMANNWTVLPGVCHHVHWAEIDIYAE